MTSSLAALFELLEVEEDDISNLVDRFGIDPAKDFQNCDLRNVDFGNLSADVLDLSGSETDGINLSRIRCKRIIGAGYPEDETTVEVRGSRSQLVAEYLPLLRRYARGLYGNQSAGDAYVAAMLEALLQDPTLLDDRFGPRAGLFKLFYRIVSSVEVHDDKSEPPVDTVLSRLQVLGFPKRAAFLLLSLEGFQTPEAAFILGIEPEALLADVVSISSELDDPKTVLIIEDDPASYARASKTLHRLVGQKLLQARDNDQALELVKDHSVGLIISEVKLENEQSGLQIVNQILRTQDIPTIFLTQYPEIFLTGERPEPAFLVTKPYDEGILLAVTIQCLFFNRKRRVTNDSGTRSEELKNN